MTRYTDQSRNLPRVEVTTTTDGRYLVNGAPVLPERLPAVGCDGYLLGVRLVRDASGKAIGLWRVDE